VGYYPFMDDPPFGPIPAILTTILFVGIFISIFSLVFIRFRDHVRGSCVIIFAFALIAGVTCVELGVPTPVTVTVESIMAVLTALFFYGPFRVSGWAWPKGGKRAIPRIVSVILIIAATAVTVLLTVLSYSPYVPYPLASKINDSVPVLFQAFLIWPASYYLFWGMYKILTGCFTFTKEVKTGVFQDSWIEGHSHIVTFGSDANGYHVSPKLFEEMTSRRKGLAYSYTLVTGLSGTQFIRKPPQLTSVPQQGYAAYDEAIEEPAPAEKRDIPAPRLLGGDGHFEMNMLAPKNLS